MHTTRILLNPSGLKRWLALGACGLLAAGLTLAARVFPPDATPAQNMKGPPAPPGWPAAATNPADNGPVDIPQAHMHSPAEEIAMTRLPPGYHLELIASEPDIIAPVCLAWDGDGRMYAAEMQTYMLDIDASHEHDPKSRVIRFDDTHGNGIYDKHTVFVDHMVLPRMILPLDDRILIRETNTKDIYSYRDTKGTGTADEKQLVFKGGVQTGNVEHQPSGLLWDLNNWIYITAEDVRFRYKNGKLIESKIPAGLGQWGIAMEDTGQLMFSQAGSEHPALFFQAMPEYGPINLPGDVPPHFNEVYPILPTTDIQGGLRRLKMGGGLSHFTGCGGGSIYRGDALPHDLDGDYLLPEPVGRLIRRAKINDEDGEWVLSNAYDKREFIASMDANFRPVWTATGPDGCLYICDMYHGIIQEAEWDKPGTFLRPQIEKYGLQKNILHGRIFRLTYDGMKRREKPHMLEETSVQLVAHLSDPNGWWRDTAQKLLILRGDKSVVPLLQQLARTGNPIARIHALWTLDGLEATEPALLLEKLKDPDYRVRCAAVQIAEPLITRNSQLLKAVSDLAATDSNPHVASQVCLSLLYTKVQQADATVDAAMSAREKAGLTTKTPLAIVAAYRAELEKARQVASRQAALAKKDPKLAETVALGRSLYMQTCIACHGPDGRGMPSPAGTGTLAPPLAGSKRLTGNPEITCRIVLHGLVGPNDGGVIYPNEMAGFPWADDNFISAVLTYARQEWGNNAGPIHVARVAKVRKETADRTKPYTLAELAELKLPGNSAAPPAAQQSEKK